MCIYIYICLFFTCIYIYIFLCAILFEKYIRHRSKVWDHLEMSLFFKVKLFFSIKITLINNTLSTLLMW